MTVDPPAAEQLELTIIDDTLDFGEWLRQVSIVPVPDPPADTPAELKAA